MIRPAYISAVFMSSSADLSFFFSYISLNQLAHKHCHAYVPSRGILRPATNVRTLDALNHVLTFHLLNRKWIFFH